MIALLLQHNSDIMLTNNNGFNVLHHSALRGNSRLVEISFSGLLVCHAVDIYLGFGLSRSRFEFNFGRIRS